MELFHLDVDGVLHIIDDFCLQPICLNRLKDRYWWRENVPDPKKIYSWDFAMGLIMHGYSWAFMIMLPIASQMDFIVDKRFVWILILNGIIHALIDHLKCNARKLNLWEDQSLHLIQIALTFWYFKLNIGV